MPRAEQLAALVPGDGQDEEPERFHMVIAGRDVWLTEAECRDYDARPPEYAGRPVGLTPAEQAEDLASLQALAERRKQLRPEQRRPYDAAFDRRLADNVARREAQVWTLRLRGALRKRTGATSARCITRSRDRRPSRRHITRAHTTRGAPARPRLDDDDLAALAGVAA